MDQPSNDGVNSYFVAKAAREAGLTVVLSGVGGDELFRGYRHYHWMARNGRALGLFAGMPEMARRACVTGAAAYGRLRGRESWMRLGGLGQGVAPESLYLAFRGFFPSQQARELLGAGQAEMDSLVAENRAMLRPEVNGTFANGVNYIEMKRYLHDQLLRDTDAFSMAHSVEVRTPYLDDGEWCGWRGGMPGGVRRLTARGTSRCWWRRSAMRRSPKRRGGRSEAFRSP